MKRTFITLATAIALAVCTSYAAPVKLTDKGQAVSKIRIDTSHPTSVEAATMLNRFVREISGAELAVVDLKTTQAKGAVSIICDNALAGQEVREDGYRIDSRNGAVTIIGRAEDRGVQYAVATLLEQFMGVDYLAKEAYTLTKRADITLPDTICMVDNPAFRYRQTHSYNLEDSTYRRWFRLEEPREMFAANLWVHTFNHLLPASVYGKSHPEYYALINGQRRPGKEVQWCLTNPEVFEIVAQRLDSIFKANPDRRMISVSQNDGNMTQCTCEECVKVDKYEESLSGNLVRFMNRLAERFPDKEISTLAYLYSVKPPKHTKPLPNVNIMLCDIDCTREVTLPENSSGSEFMKSLEGWGRISDNIFVWDYGINFDNQVSPFPNFHILQENIQHFKNNGATMLFEQVNGSKGTDFAELRAYMLAKLMWNPDQNADSLMRRFLDGYYGQAAPYLYQYLKLQEGALIASGVRLWIYDSPVSHKKGMLQPLLMKRYNRLFDQAELAVAKDTVLLKRVQMSRLPLQYAELEIARTEAEKNIEELTSKLELFRSRATEFAIPTLNERGNSPLLYCDLYKERYMPRERKSIASGAKVSYTKVPAKGYAKIGEYALTDDLYGGATFVESWVGWLGGDGEFVIDLGAEKQFSEVSVDFLHQLGQWIFLPKGVVYSISDDGVNFTEIGRDYKPEDRSGSVKYVSFETKSPQMVKARYIKVFIEGVGTCPDWHNGIGHPGWFFADEVVVY